MSNRANRPSPSLSATLYDAGDRMRGNDGNMYQIVQSYKGTNRWSKLAKDSQYESGGHILHKVREPGQVIEMLEDTGLYQDFMSADTDEIRYNIFENAEEIIEKGVYKEGGKTKYEGAEITGYYNEYGSAYQDEVEDAVRDLTSEQYEAFCYDYNVDPNNANEMSDFIANLDQEEAEDIMTHIRTTGELEDRMKGMGYAKGGKLPSQEEVDKSFSEWEMETHYLNNKPVKGQKPSSNKVEIDEWDKYDLSNWNALVSSNRKIKKFSKGGKVGMIKTSKKAHSLVDTTEKVKEINKKIRKNGLTFIYDYGWLTTSDNYPGVYVKSEPFRIKDEMIIDLKDGEIGYGDTLERIIVKTPKNLNGQEFLDWHFKQIENFFREPISVDKWTDHLIFDEMGELSSHNTTNFAKGGEVKKKGNEMLIGGLAGILLGIFLNK